MSHLTVAQAAGVIVLAALAILVGVHTGYRSFSVDVGA